MERIRTSTYQENILCKVRRMVLNATYNIIFSYIVAVSFIGGGNRST
jgi:hypothetical protein